MKHVINSLFANFNLLDAEIDKGHIVYPMFILVMVSCVSVTIKCMHFALL